MSLRRRNSQSEKKKPEAGAAQLKKAASYQEDHEGKKLSNARTVYSLWSSAKYILILSLLLWWLPMFGQMIAGYVGGRKAGGPWRGIIAAILPVLAIFAIITAFENGILPDEVFGVGIRPSALLGGLASSIPFLGPYFEFTQEYVSQFVSALAGSSPYGINSYVLTVAFAYIGGIIAEQNRKEIEFTSGASTSHTTILVTPEQIKGQVGVAQFPAAGVVVPQQAVGFLPHDHHMMQNERSLSRAIMRFFHQQEGHGRARSVEQFDQLVPANMTEQQSYGMNETVEMSEKKIRRRRAAAREAAPRKMKKTRRRSKKIRMSDKQAAAHKKSSRKVRKTGVPAVPRATANSANRKVSRKDKSSAGWKAERKHSSPKRALKVDPRNPKTLRRVHKYIEDEWNPKGRKMKHPGPAPHPRRQVQGIRTASNNQRHSGSADFAKSNKRFARRSWESM